MSKTILITGSTDGIGLETARMLATLGHQILLHGRNSGKLENAQHSLSSLSGGGHVEGFVASAGRGNPRAGCSRDARETRCANQ